MIAGLEAAHAGAQRFHDTRAFMTQHDGLRRMPARVFVQVGVADARGHQPHQHLACAGRLQVERFQHWCVALATTDGRGDLHGLPFRLGLDTGACGGRLMVISPCQGMSASCVQPLTDRLWNFQRPSFFVTWSVRVPMPNTKLFL